MKKVRVDQYIYEHFNVGSVDKIGRYIMAGQVLNQNAPVYKPSEMIDPERADIRFKHMKQFVSRGGHKLAYAIEHFDFTVKDQVMIDVGSSTGGFTDCALQHGAKHVYAVDVGTNQLDYRLRTDENVTVMEQTNFKDTPPDDFIDIPSVITIDVSFTSIIPIINHIHALFQHEVTVIGLVKPQFESYKEEIEDGGIITSLNTHINVLERVIEHLNTLGFSVLNVAQSPIKGHKGNVEYLLHAKYTSGNLATIDGETIANTVKNHS